MTEPEPLGAGDPRSSGREGTQGGAAASGGISAGSTSPAGPPGETVEINRTSRRGRTKRFKRYEIHLLAAYLVCAVTALIFLRTRVETVDFLGVGWIVVLATLPLLPWLIPRLGEFARAVSPYVQTLKVGAVQVDLRAVGSAPPSIATAGMQPSLPNDVAALSSGTGISSLMNALHDLSRQGGSPVGIIDLRNGNKWRLPNLYFLSRLLELDPVVRELAFTEMKGGIDGYLVGSGYPDDIRRRIEVAVPQYADAAAMLPRRDVLTLADPGMAQPVGTDFQSFLNSLGVNSGRDDDPVFGYLTSVRLTAVAGPLSDAAVEGLGTVLTDKQLIAIVQSPVQFVPATTIGRLTGFIDRNAIALAAARSAAAAS